ncbi:MAG TPA: hypothetical protein VK666_27675 [Chryseolinea sp.]|nr:hypothetical protein [Chryseolinea sp.]
MARRKILGYILTTLSIILLLLAIAQLPALFAAAFAFFKMLTGELDGYGVGYLMGTLLFWVSYFYIITVCWKYGRKWTSKLPATIKANGPVKHDASATDGNQ